VPSFILSGAPFFHRFGTKLGAGRALGIEVEHAGFGYFSPIVPELMDAAKSFA
jgi:hypothetical protein